MNSINLVKNQSQSWFYELINESEIWVKGKVFHNNVLVEGKDFLNLFISQIFGPLDTKEISKILSDINGNFSVVIRKAKHVVAIVDRARSFPLFYCLRHDDFFLSDDAHLIKEQSGVSVFDPVSADEFRLCGYVTGNCTLYADLKQIPAGQLLFAIDKEIQLLSYYSYNYYESMVRPKSELTLELDDILNRSFQRLITWVKGKTIAIPLSGGYDSRFIALMLKKLGYNNIVTFTYGRKGNEESEISRRIADKLGLRWEFVEYTNDLWYKWFHSDEKQKYYKFSDGLSSLPIIAGLPAISQLKDNGCIPKDSVIVSGTTVALAMKMPFVKTKEDLVNWIIRYHYYLWPWESSPYKIREQIINKINVLISNFITRSPNWCANAFESWFLTERQVKFIVNFNREYEFYGFNWYMPLWDLELYEFWKQLPLEHRFDKMLFKTYADKSFEKVTKTQVKYAWRNPIKNKFLLKIFRYAKIDYLYRAIVKLFNKYGAYENEYMAAFGIMQKKQFKKIYSGKEDKYSFYVLEYLGKARYR